MDLPSETSKHGKKPTSQKLEDQKKIYTDWANHYLAKSGCPRLIKDLTQDIADGVLLAEIIQIIANEKVEDINGCPRSQSQMIENVDACLSFLQARGVNIQGLSAEEIRNGNLKTILGLFFSLSRYKQQQQHQQQYFQSLVELQQQVTHQATGPTSPHKTQDMQSRLPGPSRASAAGSGTTSKVQGASNLNRRSQSFNSIDKSKPLQYASGSDRGGHVLAAHGSMSSSTSAHTSIPTPIPSSTSTSGQQLASAIPSPSASKTWRSKSMNMKHSATSSMIAARSPSPATSPTPPSGPAPSPTPGSDRLRPSPAEAPKAVGGGQRSMLEKFKLIHARPNSRPPPSSSASSVAEVPLEEQEALVECGEEVLSGPESVCSSPRLPTKAAAPSSSKSSSKMAGTKSLLPPKEKEDKSKAKGKTSTPCKDEKELVAEPSKKTSKIASLIPKGGKSSAVKKEGTAPASSGIPKPGLKTPTSGPKPTGSPASLGVAGREPEKSKVTKGSQTYYMQRSLGTLEGRRSSMVSSNSTSALSGSMSTSGGPLTGNGAVQLPQQQQQQNHPNTATVAPFMYSPTKAELVYREDPETRRMRTVKNIADLRQNLEETMSSLRGTQISHSTLETTFDSTVTTEVNGRGIPSLASRSSPMAWRLGQSASPRLQAGDAPSLPSGYPPGRATGVGRFATSDPSRFLYTQPLRRAGAGPPGAEPGEKGGAEGGMEGDVVAGYMSDGDILGKNVRVDEVSSGCNTDFPTTSLPPSLSLSLCVFFSLTPPFLPFILHPLSSGSWDDSSSVSSGLSDTLDNISTDDLNTPSYSDIGVAQRHDGAPQWTAGEELKKTDEELTGTMEAKWKPPPPSSSLGHCEDPDRAGQKTSLPLSQSGSWRRGMTAQMGIAPSRTKGATGALKTPGTGTDDAKVSERGKAPSKSSGIQRSPSDAGKSSGDEGKKPPSGITRAPPTSSFGFKKIPGAPGQLVTASGATLAGGSATLGKAPKSSAAGKSSSGAATGGRKTSLDDSQPQDDGALLGCGSPRAPLQYRSLPRPAKSSSRSSQRSSSSSADSNASGGTAGAKRRDGGTVGSGRSSPVTVNQTDKEKVAVSDSEAPGLSPKSSPTSAGQSVLRQPGSKYPDIASPTFRRLFGSKASSKASSPGTPDSGKCPSVLGSPHGTLARQGSLDSPTSGTGTLGSGGGQSGSSSPLYSVSDPPGSTPKPWAAGKDALSCQSPSGLRASTEAIDLAGHHGSLASGPKVVRTGSVNAERCLSLPTGMYPPSSRQTPHEEGKEWLRSHSTGGLQDTGNQSPLSPPSTAATTSKYNYSNLLSPTNLSQFSLPGTSMSRSNSIPAQDSSFDLRGDANTLGGSATSLEERPRGMSRSGSFRDSMEEGRCWVQEYPQPSAMRTHQLGLRSCLLCPSAVHGSSLSLVSSTSSLYSAPSLSRQQIRKLRRELDASQEKVAKLTSQLSSNAHLVAAFEKSLANMTCRLQSLTMTAEQKESELAELRETIEALKAQNTDAQTAIQVALNGPDHVNKGIALTALGTRRLTAVTDRGRGLLSSQLRSSFKQAFGKKKSNKPPSPHSDIEEQTDSSLPSSPKLQPAAKQGGASSLRPSPSTTELCECTEAEAEIILQLKNELREKELKLTDIRLEALSSAHQLDQIREAMNRMQNEIELLKAENDRLKSTGSNTAAPPAKTPRPPSETSSTSSSSSRQSLGLSLNNLNMTDTIMSGELVAGFIPISLPYSSHLDYLIGSIGVSGKTKWDVLDGVTRRLFKEYMFRVDPATNLGLTSDSIACYRLSDVVRATGSEVPELLPCGYLVGDNNIITVSLKGVKENSVDELVFDTLIPKTIIQRYLNLLVEHRRIILSGPSGTGKSFLASKLAEFIVAKSGREFTEGSVVSFCVDHKSSKDLQQYLSTLAEQCSSAQGDTELPSVVILDNLHHIGSLSDIFNGFLNCKFHQCPYVIGTMNQGVSSSPNLELHHNFRWVLCANHTEPVKGFLGRFLRRKLIETEIEKSVRSNDLIKIVDWIPKAWQHLNSFLEAHSSSDVTIGPRLFLSCPMDVDGSRVWFTDLWNYSLVPYLLEAVREGLQLYGKRTMWEDPSKWVIDTCPWSSASLQHDWQGLLQLRPEDVGYDGYSSAKEGSSSKQVSQSDTEGDPLMNMLMKLQEAANYSSAQSCDSDGHHGDLPDSSLESTL
uniref:Neuron navigator 3 n=1 Tax=Scleropages formosus TaxID=113540 RepID=A0A8C9U6B5_SCLFO